jgi:hypothetical protein
MLKTVPRTMASQNGRVAQARQEAKLEDLEKVLQHISSYITNGTQNNPLDDLCYTNQLPDRGYTPTTEFLPF